MTLFKQCFGDLPKREQEHLFKQLNKINKIVELPLINKEELKKKE